MQRTCTNMPSSVTFICDDGNARHDANLAVLAACSKYFSNLETTCEGVKPLIIAVPDATTAEMECILKFVYFGEFDDAVVKVGARTNVMFTYSFSRRSLKLRRIWCKLQKG